MKICSVCENVSFRSYFTFSCKEEFHGFPHCKPCICSDKGATSSYCDSTTAQVSSTHTHTHRHIINFVNCQINNHFLFQCNCYLGFEGQECNKCSPGYYNYPNCTGK